MTGEGHRELFWSEGIVIISHILCITCFLLLTGHPLA